MKITSRMTYEHLLALFKAMEEYKRLHKIYRPAR